MYVCTVPVCGSTTSHSKRQKHSRLIGKFSKILGAPRHVKTRMHSYSKYVHKRIHISIFAAGGGVAFSKTGGENVDSISIFLLGVQKKISRKLGKSGPHDTCVCWVRERGRECEAWEGGKIQ